MWRALQSLVILGLISGVRPATTSATSKVTAASSTPTVATCPSRTANVITHNLPQQCLTASRRSPESVLLSNATTANAAAATSASPPRSDDTVVNLATNLTELLLGNASTSAAVSTVSIASKNPAATQEAPIALLAAPEEASPLDDGKFMSFEDWKTQNLQKAGQSEHLGKDVPVDQLSQRKQPVNIHAALDTLGDDAEIELDFSGLLPDGPDLSGSTRGTSEQPASEQRSETDASTLPKIRSSGKDAGTTCKERFNYASFDCAANVLKTNSEALSASAVLGENKDSYMLNVCSAENKHLILELCDDISIDTVVIANYEFFSSIFRTFRVSVSDKYPVKTEKWKTLGTFEARNTRDIQAFLIENPVIWARYLRIDFLTHYGKEYYCPVSLVRVHGTTMLEEYKHDLESALGHDDEDLDVTEATTVDSKVLQSLTESEAPTLEPATSTAMVEEPVTANAVKAASDDDHTASSVVPLPVSSSPVASSNTATCNVTSVLESATSSSSVKGLLSTSSASNATMQLPATSMAVANVTNQASVLNQTSQFSLNHTSTANGTNSTSLASNSSVPVNATNAVSSKNVTTTDRPKSSGTTTQSPAAVPTMQESFFKSVQKRLQMLESNSSLSLQYIEDQSRALRDAFNKVEQRQLTKTSTFLDHLNSTVLSELREFRQQYDHLWQSTVIELEVQRERYHHETEAMNARLGILADELIYQKRLSILQMMIVLICLALVMFSKGTFNQYLELPLLQSVLARSPSSRWLNTGSLDTPTQSPPTTRQNSIRKRGGILKGHARLESESSIDNPAEYAPPTPTSMSYDDASEADISQQQNAIDDPEFDPMTIERPRTSPPELQTILPSSPEATDASDQESIDARLHELTPDRAHTAVPRVIIEHATPPHKQLSWDLPDSRSRTE